MANRVRLQWEKAVDLVHDVLRVMVDHQQIVNKSEDVGVMLPTIWVCLLFEPQVRVSWT